MAILYQDRRIAADEDGITVSMYYFPFGSKRIPYSAIRSWEEYEMGALTGQWRIWGMGTSPRWFCLDADRPRKTRAFILDIGGWIKPVLTHDDPDPFRRVLEERAGK
jgi:hypothetical protein